MEIFGFISLVLIALLLTGTSAFGLMVTYSFSGKTEPALWVLAAIAICLWIACWHFAPFEISMKGQP